MNAVRIVAAALALFLAACAQPTAREAPAAPAVAEAPLFVLQNAGFEEEFPDGRNCPPKWTCRAHADGRAFRLTSSAPATGRRGLLVERIGIEPWVTVEQAVPPLGVRGRRVRLSMSIKYDKLVGLGGGPFILVVGPAPYHEHKLDLRTGTGDWQRAVIEVDVPAGADRVEVGALLEADGQLWIDDAVFEVLPRARP
jgi:hypothetical protein